jgi:hypothetical protein
MSGASAKSVSESPPSSVRAARVNTAPMPVFTVRGTVCRTAVLAIREKGCLRPVPPPQLPYLVEDDDGVVDRVPDHGEQRGEEPC